MPPASGNEHPQVTYCGRLPAPPQPGLKGISLVFSKPAGRNQAPDQKEKKRCCTIESFRVKIEKIGRLMTFRKYQKVMMVATFAEAGNLRPLRR